jgi:acetylornithine deacetylase/succinyl-diaminopimelate desuccinylase-like protein
MRRLITILLLVAGLTTTGARAQNGTVAQYLEEVRAIQNRSDVKTALAHVDASRADILREWSVLTEINAPSGQEKTRAAYIEKLLRKYKLQEIHYDQAGNLIAVRKGTGGGPTVVFDAHLDTVFQPGLKIKTDIREGRMYAPGVGDDTRNIEAMLATVRALNAAHIQTKGDLVLLFTVEEETTMRGAKQFVEENKGKVDHYVALDGGYEGFTYAGIGINWYRHHFIGPGGHTRSRTPPYSAALPLARAITRIYELDVPNNPSSNLNIGMLGGSEVVNAKASDAWFTLDLRSTSDDVINDLEKKIAAILQEEATRAGMTVKTDIISASPPAVRPGNRDSYIVRMSEAVHRAMGLSSISTGAGPCDDSHSLKESCEIEPFYNGIKKILLLELSLTGVSGEK